MKTDFTIKGKLVPVFTPFLDDEKRTINFDIIDKYAKYLKDAGMTGVIINGVLGEGTILTVEERMKLTEVWFEITRKYGLLLVVNIGGIDLTDVYKLAEHAEKLKVDAVVVMTDLLYKPIVEEDFVVYLKDILLRMPTRPVFYYHIPFMTRVRFDILRLLTLLDKEIPTLAGVYWVDDRIDKLVLVREKLPHFNYIVGTLFSIMSFMTLEFDTFALPIMNVVPELIREIYDFMMKKKWDDAIVVHKKILHRIVDLFKIDTDLRINFDVLLILRREFEKKYPEIKLGPVRRPFLTLNRLLW